ncbi:MAG TPA: PKD domain-containing protein [Brumimicrobium sp.]|nr:PKD domain-containing protein [Brumimicrobium sp.]
MIRVLTLLFALLLMQFVNSQCPDLTPQFTLSQNQFCGPGPHTISLTNTSIGVNNTVSIYDWVLDGVTIATTNGLDAPTDIQLSTPGIYNLELVGTDTVPCTASTSLQIEVLPKPASSFTFSPNGECATELITFTNTSSNTTPTTTYTWDFGDGSTSTDENPTHSYEEGGDYDVTLIVTNGVGCTDNSTQTINALEVPIFGINPNTGLKESYVDIPLKCLTAGSSETTHTVNFTNNTTGAISYSWDFGDGNSSTSADPTHTYTTYGTFPVTMTATGPNGCIVTSTLSVAFEKFVSASLSLPPEDYSGCAPITLDLLINNSVNATNYVWDFGDGSAPYMTTDPTPPNHAYTTSSPPSSPSNPLGGYTITLTASNSCNAAATTIKPIIILAKPAISFSLSGNTTCAPATTNFINNTTGTEPANKYSWDMGNGNTYEWTKNPPAQTYSNAGSYTISLTTSNTCGDTTLYRTIDLDTIPIADFNLDPDEGCSPLTVNLENTSIGNVTQYRWYHQNYSSGTNSGYSYGPNYGPLTYTYSPGNAPITRNITLRALNNCGSTSITKPVVIHRPTQARFNTSATTVCLGNPITFTDNSLGEDLTYEWNFGNDSINTEKGAHTITYDQPGDYEVRLVAKGYCGNDTIVKTVTVHPLTEIEMTTTDLLEDCSPMDVSFENNSTGANLSYQWRVDGTYIGNSKNFGPYNFTETPGNAAVEHTIQLTVSSSCGTYTKDTIVTVHRPTQANMSILPEEACLGESVVATESSLGEDLTYKWDFGDGSTSTDAGPHIIEYTTDRTYDILFVALGYCGPDTVTTSVTIHPFPVADFSPDLTDGCEVLDVTFTNNSTPSAEQNWNFGPNATPATSSNFDPGEVSFPNAGTQQIVLVVEENGCISSDTNYIEVLPLPQLDFELIPNEGCSDLEVQINNTSIDNGVEDFTWDLGNGDSFTGFSPTNQIYIAINNDSIYEVKLHVISGSGCEDSLTHQVVVHPVPEADFDFAIDSICQNTNAQFINNSTPGMSYEWEFGDGNTSNSATPTHQYANDGKYLVQLVVNSPFTCSDTITKEIVVHPIPEAIFTASTACFGYETEFTDQSLGNITEWNWTFGDENTSTDQNPTHLYPNAGSFTAELSVTNNFNCITSQTSIVDINEIPIADFSSDHFCLGDNIEFTNLTIGATIGYEWDFGDGSAFNTTENPSHNYATVGDYEVRLVAFGGSGCSDTISKTNTINPVPSADFTFLNACAEDTTFFTDISDGTPDNYTWDFGNGSTDQINEQNPAIVYANDGTYTVSLTVGFDLTGCNNTTTYQIDAHPRTNPQFTATTACFGNETAFEETTNDLLIDTWEWDFGDGSVINTTKNPTYTYPEPAAPGNFDVKLVTENIFGCSDTIIQNVVVNELPVPGFDFDIVCLNSATSFIDTSKFSTGWEYSFGDGNSANTSDPHHTFLADGEYTVQQIVTNSLNCKDSIAATITVRPNPSAIFSTDIACFSYPTTFTNQSTDAIASQWIFDDLGSISADYSPTYTYSEDGTFTPQLVVENIYGCTDTVTESALVLPQPTAAFSNTTVCAKDIVTFTNTSSGSPTIFDWDLDDGSGTFTTENISHTFSHGGIYNITLIVENAAGCSDTLREPVEVYTVPDVSFTADTVCLFSITHFNDLSNDVTAIANWDWSFGDGNTSFDQNPTYIYQNDGVYDVSLTVTNTKGCDSTFTEQVLVSLVPTADFDYVSDCFGAPTVFTDLSTNNPGIYHWDFGDGTTRNGGTNEQHTYTAPGIYLVELNVEGTNGVCSDSKVKVINIADGAQADFFIPEQICVNDVFNFYDNSSASIGTIANYEWIMSDGETYNTQNGTHAFTTPGIHEVTINISTSDGCQATQTKSVEVLPSTSADFEWSGTCSNSSTQFTNTSGGGTTNWFWNFDDGVTEQSQFPTHTFTSEGDYSVMLIVQNLYGCADTIVQEITIDPAPSPDFLSDKVCFGDLTTFSNSSSINSGTIDSYEWIFGENEGTSSVDKPLYEFTTYEESHPVTLIVTSDKGCSDTITKTVDLLPIVDFEIDFGDQFGCAPITLVFDNHSIITGATIFNYEWDFGDGSTSFQKSPVHTFLKPGNYPVSLTVVTSTDCKIVLTDGLDLEVFPSPTAGFDVNPPITSVSEAFIKITDESQGATLWEYDLGNGHHSNSPSLSHNFNEVGSYYITQFVQNDFGCSDSTQRAIEIQEEFLLYVPNSFTPDDNNSLNDYFTWTVAGYKTFEMRVFNRWGELVYETKDADGQWDGKENGFKVRDGVYVWQVQVLDLNGDERIITGHVNVLK